MTDQPDRGDEANPQVQSRIRDSFAQQGLMHHLGARLTYIGHGRVHIELPVRPELTQQDGYVHAGATSAIADSAGGYAALTGFPDDASVLTIEYKINLVAPAAGDRLEAEGTVLKTGRTLTITRLDVYAVTDHQRTLVATGQQTLICVRSPQN